MKKTTENAEAIKGLFQRLILHGLSFERGILCIIYGSKGLYKAVREVFGEYSAAKCGNDFLTLFLSLSSRFCLCCLVQRLLFDACCQKRNLIHSGHSISACKV